MARNTVLYVFQPMNSCMSTLLAIHLGISQYFVIRILAHGLHLGMRTDRSEPYGKLVSTPEPNTLVVPACLELIELRTVLQATKVRCPISASVCRLLHVTIPQR